MLSEAKTLQMSGPKRSRECDEDFLEKGSNRVSADNSGDGGQGGSVSMKKKRCLTTSQDVHTSEELGNFRSKAFSSSPPVEIKCAQRLVKLEGVGEEISPVLFLKSILRSGELPVRPVFTKPTQEELLAYNTEVVQAVRSRDMEKLKQVRSKGQSLQCCNRFGESLIHMACRRGYGDVVSFLVEEANVSIHIQDDFGRTPMHDACWASVPNFEVMDILIRKEAGLLLVSDIRGHTPFDYARREHWGKWVSFLKQRKHLLIKSNDE
mmetsp:Transcript_10996/g.20962  ORF Transcript_10996/g.20962 Transcript_10996/m.20962 type:complete len:265 (-) Transcript_10996:26-820(-)